MGSRWIVPALLVFASAISCGLGGGPPASVSGPTAKVCGADLRLVLGACVSPAVAAQRCGAASIATLDGCAARPACEPGRARDLESGACMARRDVRTLASSLGILVRDDETLICPAGGELATGNVEESPRGPRLGCLPRFSRPDAAGCPAGAIDDGGCVRFGASGQIDVVRWLRAVVGPDGGAAAPPLCGALQRSRGALAIPGSVDVRVQVALAFPDNDVTQVTATVHGSGAATAELEQVMAPMVEALRSVGGTANQASIATAVRCRRTSERPAVLLNTEGASSGPQIR